MSEIVNIKAKINDSPKNDDNTVKTETTLETLNTEETAEPSQLPPGIKAPELTPEQIKLEKEQKEVYDNFRRDWDRKYTKGKCETLLGFYFRTANDVANLTEHIKHLNEGMQQVMMKADVLATIVHRIPGIQDIIEKMNAEVLAEAEKQAKENPKTEDNSKPEAEENHNES
jgi:hypothetical protein